ncbi:GFA family protein [Oceanicaulis sp.]|uniref:GFA family protein n=1 Tax=Oceanicaulis sp. TaxID=1924941 RepID=UPI003F717C9A
MHFPREGGCQCGAVRYAVTREPASLYCCHCTNCQAQSGAAFAMSMLVARDGFDFVQGEPQAYHFVADSGNRKIGWFCPDCGVRLMHDTEGRDTITVRAGTLDGAQELQPVGHIWTRSAQAWMQFDQDQLVYAQAPDDGYAALKSSWTRQQSQIPG